MKSKKGIRITLNILLFGSVFFSPWYVTLIVVLLLLVLYNPLEIVLAGILIDALHGIELFGTEYVFTIFFLLLYVLFRVLKKNLLLYS